MAAGKKKGPMLIIFTAMILAVMRPVTKMAEIITNRYETFIMARPLLATSNQMFTVEEVEHAANNDEYKKGNKKKGVTRILKRQGDIHTPDTGDYANR